MSTEEELVVLLDDDGTPIGTAPKATVHHGSTPLHLAFSCYVFDEAGRLLVTQRALGKPTFPGVWTNTVCGHPGPGEDMVDALRRRARDELGIAVEDVTVVLPEFRYDATMPNGVRENEICPVFVATTRDQVTPNPDEVEAVDWVAWETFRDDVLHGRREVSVWCAAQVAALHDLRPPAASPSVGDAVQVLLDEGRVRADKVGLGQRELWDAVVAAADGGKRFRPTLLVRTHAALGGRQPAVAARVGAAVELLHTALVIHDDVIDRADVRRGRLNVRGRYARGAAQQGADRAAAEHVGSSAALLAGDLALAAAVRAVATCGADAPTTERLLDLVDDALHAGTAGELADVVLATGTEPAALEAVLDSARLKTAAYSFVLPLLAAAVLAEAPASTQDALAAAGVDLGIAFQLRDDVLGVFGDPAVTGKSALSDLREGKQTALVAHARTTTAWPVVEQHLGRADLTEEDAAVVRAALERSGSREHVERLAEDRTAAALDMLRPFDLDSVVVEVLSGPRGSSRTRS